VLGKGQGGLEKQGKPHQELRTLREIITVYITGLSADNSRGGNSTTSFSRRLYERGYSLGYIHRNRKRGGLSALLGLQG
jgi:hypothetical protein